LGAFQISELLLIRLARLAKLKWFLY